MSKSTVVIDYNDILLQDRSAQTFDSQEFAAWHEDKENIEIMKKNLMTDVDIDNSTNQFSEQQVVDRKNYSEVYWLQNDSKRFSENITNALKYILGLYDFNVGYISNHIKEWHGIVDSIDLNENKFKVLFVDPSDKEGEYLVEFRFLYKGIIINHNKKPSQPTLKRRFFKKKAAFFHGPVWERSGADFILKRKGEFF